MIPIIEYMVSITGDTLEVMIVFMRCSYCIVIGKEL